MGKNKIDASLGLAFSLVLFEQYKRNGHLQAELYHVPGFHGRCVGYLHLVDGKVVSCYIEDKQGHRYPMGKDRLARLDRERGPFGWVFMPLPASPSPRTEPLSRSTQGGVPIPMRSAPLDLERLEGWTYSQKMMLSIVYDAVNGQRMIEDIKASTPLPPYTVEEALRVLLALKVIVIPS